MSSVHSMPQTLTITMFYSCCLAINIFIFTPLNPRYLCQHFNDVFPFSPLFSFLILKFINLQGKTLLKFEYSFSFILFFFQSFFQYFKYLSFFFSHFLFSFFFIFPFFFSLIFFLSVII